MNQQRILEHCPICDGNNLVVYKRRSRLAGQLITVECRNCLCSAPITGTTADQLHRCSTPYCPTPVSYAWRTKASINPQPR